MSERLLDYLARSKTRRRAIIDRSNQILGDYIYNCKFKPKIEAKNTAHSENGNFLPPIAPCRVIWQDVPWPESTKSGSYGVSKSLCPRKVNSKSSVNEHRM